MADNPYPPLDHPRRIADIWVQAWNRRNADRLAALFEADAEFVNVTGLWWHDREAIRRAHDYGLRTIFDQSTIALVTRRTVFTFVVRRTEEGWRCASAQNTDVVPGAETNVIDDQGRIHAVTYRSGAPTDRN